MKERIEVLLSAEQIDRRMAELADELYQEFGDEQVELVWCAEGRSCDHRGSGKENEDARYHEFHERFQLRQQHGKLRQYQYQDGSGCGYYRQECADCRRISDTGRTLKKLKELLISRNPKKLKLVTLLDKPDRRVVDIKADYTGFTIPDAFVVGYGLDYAQKYRNRLM